MKDASGLSRVSIGSPSSVSMTMRSGINTLRLCGVGKGETVKCCSCVRISKTLSINKPGCCFTCQIAPSIETSARSLLKAFQQSRPPCESTASSSRSCKGCSFDLDVLDRLLNQGSHRTHLGREVGPHSARPVTRRGTCSWRIGAERAAMVIAPDGRARGRECLSKIAHPEGSVRQQTELRQGHRGQPSCFVAGKDEVRLGSGTSIATLDRLRLSVVKRGSYLPLNSARVVVLDPQLRVVLPHEFFDHRAALRGLLLVGVE